jgi:hypothetical protein
LGRLRQRGVNCTERGLWRSSGVPANLQVSLGPHIHAQKLLEAKKYQTEGSDRAHIALELLTSQKERAFNTRNSRVLRRTLPQ